MIMSMLGKLFGKKKKQLAPSTQLKVCIVNDESDDLYEVFGITKERKQELNKLTHAAFHNQEDSSKSYVEIVEQCKHVNEIIVCAIVFERIKDSRSSSMGSMLAELFGKK